MADSRRYSLNPQLDIEQILQEAQHRWLRPSEVCEILRNYQKFYLTPDPPHKPPGGSLFLFDRRALRYFRKDGHCWRKKKDGKTVREAHEKLKAGSVDVLHCYYAHGEDNENFQRRSYWMLDGQLEHIVLVHYREVKEGNRISNHLLLNPGTLNHTGCAQTSSAACSTQRNSPAIAAQPSYASSPSTANWNGKTPSSEHEDVDSGDDFGSSSLTEPISCSGLQIASLHASFTADKNQLGSRSAMSYPYPSGSTGVTRIIGGSINPYYVNEVPTPNFIPNEGLQADYRSSQEAGFPGLSRKYPGAGVSREGDLSTWSESLSSSRKLTSMYDQKMTFSQNNDAEVLAEKLSDHTVGSYRLIKDGQDGVHPQTHVRNALQEHLKEENAGRVANGQSLGFETEDVLGLKNAPESSLDNDHGELKKLDSFGRWMDNEIGRDCEDSLMASDSCNYWNTLDTQNDDKEVSSLSRHMQLNVDSMGPSLSQEQLFSIHDFSPDWAYSAFETKVLISGTFLGGVENPHNVRWCCMFGEVEVPAEVLSSNALRCQAPAHAPGRVPFYITCSNRLACSEVREFEYREKPSAFTQFLGDKNKPEEEVRLQIRLSKMLFQRVVLDCSIENCEKCSLKGIFSSRSTYDNDWSKIEMAFKALEKDHEDTSEAFMQILLKDRLFEWLICKAHEGGKGPNMLDDEGQGVIHLAAALGYEWAMSPIVAAGVNPSFRDARGRTGLHWAAYYGREETVVTLVRLGAAPGAVEDPTSKFPEGPTAADLAYGRGHKGIAGYLAELALTGHLSSLTLKESAMGNVIDSVSVNLATEKALQIVEEQSITTLDGDQEDRQSLSGSLAAVRNSAQAAARIQAAFHVHSFRQRQLTKCSDDDSEISSDLVALASMNSKPRKVGRFSDSLHAAAVRIQQKYHGWKGRKEFLKIRNRIIKIQAHVRGHQVRKQYKKVVWSVSIVEKAILRWRRKGAGLRGFRAGNTIKNTEPGNERIDEYEFLRVGREQKVAGVEKALARVQSMVRHQEGREQYMRLVKKFQKLKMDDKGNASDNIQDSEEIKADEEILAPMD